MAHHFPQAPCLYFCLSADGTIQEVNDQLCQNLGYGANELTGLKSDVLFTLPTRIFQQTHFLPLLQLQGHAEEIFITLRKKDGTPLPVLLNAESQTTGTGVVFLYAGIVVHHRQKFEEELIAARKAAEAALHENAALAQAKQQLQQHAEALDGQIQLVHRQHEELRQFNRVVTHDIQEPLRKLTVFSQMLFEETDRQAQLAIVEKITRAMTQMTTIVSGLQQYVWLNETPLQPATINLCALLAGVQATLQAEQQPVKLEWQVAADPLVTADPEQMQVLFYQLLSNAFRFRKEEATATVTIHADTLRLNRFRNVEGKYKYVEYIRVQVQDKGIGFDVEDKDMPFGLFKRLHKQSGRGVGLSLCKQIIDNHFGSIAIDSKKGEGTLVTLLLPAAGALQNKDAAGATNLL